MRAAHVPECGAPMPANTAAIVKTAASWPRPSSASKAWTCAADAPSHAEHDAADYGGLHDHRGECSGSRVIRPMKVLNLPDKIDEWNCGRCARSSPSRSFGILREPRASATSL